MDLRHNRFKLACTVQNGKYWNNHEPAYIRRAERLETMCGIAKELYLECLEALGEWNRKKNE